MSWLFYVYTTCVNKRGNIQSNSIKGFEVPTVDNLENGSDQHAFKKIETKTNAFIDAVNM